MSLNNKTFFSQGKAILFWVWLAVWVWQALAQDWEKTYQALSWDSVYSFMQRSFWTTDWKEFLVEVETWKRVKDYSKDLIAWKSYVLASSEQEAQLLSKKYSNKITSISLQTSQKVDSLTYWQNFQENLLKIKSLWVSSIKIQTLVGIIWDEEASKIAWDSLSTQNPLLNFYMTLGKMRVNWKDVLAQVNNAEREYDKMSQNYSFTISSKSPINPDNWGKNTNLDISTNIEPRLKLDENLSWIWFNYEAYLYSIYWVESQGKYDIDNKAALIKTWKFDWDYAVWKYQLMVSTLKWLWITDIEWFKKNPALQEATMKKYTIRHYKYALNSPSISKMLAFGLSINQMLSDMHFAWARGWERVVEYALKLWKTNPLKAYYSRLEVVKWDAFWTKRSNYLDKVNIAYNDYLSQKPHIDPKVNDFAHIQELPIILASSWNELLQRKENQLWEPKKMVSTIASNDNSFVSHNIQSDEVEVKKIASAQVEEIELIEQATSIKVSSVLKDEYRKWMIKSLEKTNLSQESKVLLAKKLAQIDDVNGYFEERISYHKWILAKKVVWLDDNSLKQFAVNEDTFKTLSKNSSIYRNSILPKLASINNVDHNTMNSILAQRIASMNMISSLEQILKHSPNIISAENDGNYASQLKKAA